LLAGVAWPMSGRCASRQNRGDVVGLKKAPTEASSYPGIAGQAKARTASVVVGLDNNLFFATTEGWLVSTRPTGQQRWQKVYGEQFSSTPTLATDGLYVASRVALYLVEPGNGNQVSKVSFGPLSSIYDGYLDKPVAGSSPVPDGDKVVYVGSLDGHVYAVRNDKQVLTTVWKYDLLVPVDTSPALHDGVLYVSTVDGSLHALDTQAPDNTTRKKWSVKLAGNDPPPTQLNRALAPTIGADGTVYAVRAGRYQVGDASLQAHRPDGTPVWSLSLPGDANASPVILPDGTLVVATQAAELLYVSPQGQLLTKVPVGLYASSPPAVDAAGNVFLATASKSGGPDLWAHDGQGKLLWSLKRGDSEHMALAIDGQGHVLAVPALERPEQLAL
ncbi:MAG: hypothetical protein EOO75_19165, partial [Myxococcales bacterium]